MSHGEKETKRITSNQRTLEREKAREGKKPWASEGHDIERRKNEQKKEKKKKKTRVHMLL